MFPCCVFPYIFKEYAPVINLSNPKKIINIIENEDVAVINIISLRRLIDGGAAILIAVNMNHHIVREGKNDIMPFIRNMLRV